MPLCPAGTEPKPGTPVAIIAGTSLITTLVGSRFPPAVPFLAALEPLLLDTGVLCAGDPPDWPSFTAQDFFDLVRGVVSPNVEQAVQNAAWYTFCQCHAAATPAAPPAPAVPNMPGYPPGTVLPCASIHAELRPFSDNLSGTYNLIGTPSAPRGIPAGATSVRMVTSGIDPGPTETSVTDYVFTLHTLGPSGTPINSPIVVAEWDFDHWLNDDVLFSLTGGASQFYVDAHPNISATGPFVAGSVVDVDYEWFCAPPGGLQTACCPPDPTITAKINRLQLTIDQVLAALGAGGPLEVLTSTPISGEGSVALVSRSRQVNIQLGLVGANTRFVPYANPDRLMRAGTIRFGNDFGWRRREHVDSTDCLFPIPPDATVVSWSLSPGTSGELVQLGAPPA